MTYEEALERIKEGDPFGEIYNAEWEEAKQKAKEALEKQIPKKIAYDENGYAMCPSCGGGIDCVMYDFHEKYAHCTACGQALDWGERGNGQ